MLDTITAYIVTWQADGATHRQVEIDPARVGVIAAVLRKTWGVDHVQLQVVDIEPDEVVAQGWGTPA